MYYIPTTQRHVRWVADYMRNVDKLECRLATGIDDIHQLLSFSVRLSDQPLTVMLDRVPVAICGVVPRDWYDIIWMLGTDLLTAHQTEFLRGASEVMKMFSHKHSGPFVNAVHETNTICIKWLEWCGAEFDAADKMGFRRFYLCVR